MASTSKCPYCGSTVRSDQLECPSCGAANERYVPDPPRTVFLPRTIEELQEYCAERGMPLLRMRFFIGEDFREPKAFGIYRDGGDVVVYKNKADGSRSVRYRGPDEEYGVRELYQKLLSECHNRGIYPDGAPVRSAEAPAQPSSRRYGDANRRAIRDLLIVLGVIAVFVIAAVFFVFRDDGYYRFEDDDRVYYRFGNSWFYTQESGDSDSWYETDGAPVSDYRDYRLGGDWDADWGVSNFRDSEAWRSYGGGSSGDDDDGDYGGDYDDWDSDDTDWESDW